MLIGLFMHAHMQSCTYSIKGCEGSCSDLKRPIDDKPGSYTPSA
jgi:hypothetical protein